MEKIYYAKWYVNFPEGWVDDEPIFVWSFFCYKSTSHLIETIIIRVRIVI